MEGTARWLANRFEPGRELKRSGFDSSTFRQFKMIKKRKLNIGICDITGKRHAAILVVKGKRYDILCDDCNKVFRSYIVNIENGLVDPYKDYLDIMGV